MHINQPSPAAMSAAELSAACEAITGLPGNGWQRGSDSHLQWYVSSVFIVHMKHAVDAAAATRAAANHILSRPNYQSYLPYLEMALGRELSGDEVEARRLLQQS